MQSHIVLKPSDNVFLTVSTTSVGLATPPTDAVSGIMVIETADVRMRWDGTAPAAGPGAGQMLAKDSIWEVVGRDLFEGMRFIRNADTDAVISVSYMKGE